MVGMHPIAAASIGIPDTLFLMVLALVVFGPRRLPEIGRQIGKLMYEFRKVSNDFKYQMEEELRAAEEADRQRKLAATISMPAVPEIAAESTPAPPTTDPAYADTTPAEAASETTQAPSEHAPSADLLPSERNRLSAQMIEVPYTPAATPVTESAAADPYPAGNPPAPEPLAVKPPSQGESVAAARPFRSAGGLPIDTTEPETTASAEESEATHG